MTAQQPGAGDLFDAPRHHAGNRVLVRSAGSQGTALFGGPLDCYRYRLGRRWGEGPSVLFIMMNPSTASAEADDATIAKVTKFAKRWGFGGLLIGNVHAYRCTDQTRLVEASDPIGPDNDRHLRAMAAEAIQIVMAYGNPKIVPLRQRGPAVARMLIRDGHELRALRVSAAGVPWHPLYLPDDTIPKPWSPGL
ncbi:DUF1643 domain-containing protein [Falsiroseomonas tokyonensis]|uniref:DUF1643 domain-containing protein n=1 Tax=Falsiroseomonas tokyonensis TaxID=430521 RepID=A0ABV7C172_9PROT|nr:DUF1643 domain-containing protein [Falsiroseomonas tokyonensis]MBU8540210.1 DUF1643 domain-containing protein [Falsiroseomonas tokyonensis]